VALLACQAYYNMLSRQARIFYEKSFDRKTNCNLGRFGQGEEHQRYLPHDGLEQSYGFSALEFVGTFFAQHP